MGSTIKILIIDDSAVVRTTLQTLFNQEPGFEVVGTASDPYKAAAILQNVIPDVITLDLEMPRMDGLTFLKKLMQQHPIPVVVCSSLVTQGAEAALTALELGAIEVIAKPELGTHEFLLESKARLYDAVRSAAAAQLHKQKKLTHKTEAKHLISEVMPEVKRQRFAASTEKIIVVGASTGGTEALKTYLQALPITSPGVLVVQHMPSNFTGPFAKHLNNVCVITVKEARNGDRVEPGLALIAPGDFHMAVKREGSHYLAQVKEGPLVNRHRPSVDVLFRSASHHAGPNTLAVIMTGMGDDGAQGCIDLKQAGSIVLAQDEASCVVFGMPKAAIERGGVHHVFPLEQLAAQTMKFINNQTPDQVLARRTHT